MLAFVVACLGGAGAVSSLLFWARERKAWNSLQRNPDEYEKHAYLRLPNDRQSEFVKTEDGAKLWATYIKGAEDRTAVFVHGLGGDSRTWSLIVPLLQDQGWSILFFDSRGCRKSTVGAGITLELLARDIRDILAHFDVTNGVLIGHSFGAFSGLLFAVNHGAVAQSRLQAMVTIGGFSGADGPCPSKTVQSILACILTACHRLVTKTTRWNSCLFTGSVLQSFGRKPAPFAVAGARTMSADMPSSIFAQYAFVSLGCELREQLHTIPFPVAVVAGESDAIVPGEKTRSLASTFGIDPVFISNSGHMVPWEQPEQLHRVISSATTTRRNRI